MAKKKTKKRTKCANYQKSSEKQPTKQQQLNFFCEVLILIVSMLHGTLFFVLAEKVIELVNQFSITNLSYLIFFFSLFFRIFQTHLLAAIKYTEKWTFKPMDFVLVFFTALFEYILFSYERILANSSQWYFYLIFAFCIFGIIGYFITYIRTRNSYENNKKSLELHIQVINMTCIFIIGMLHLVCYLKLYSVIFNLVFINFISAIIFLINIYFSLLLSKEQLKSFLYIPKS